MDSEKEAMNQQRLEHMTDQELWASLKELKRQAAWEWHYEPERHIITAEMIAEVEAEITRRDV